MNAWLLTYNPEKWQWPNFENEVNNVKNGIKAKQEWQCASKNVQVGDRVFIIQTGNKERGIFAAGHATKENYDAPHYDSARAANGEKTPHIEIELDWLLNPAVDPILDTSILDAKIPNQKWSSQLSGISINKEAYKQLELEWAKLIKVENDAYNLLKSYDDINPDKHDGSYELVREVVNSYSKLGSFDNLSFDDLDLVYSMAIIKKDEKVQLERIEKSSLPLSEKERLKEVLNDVWAKARNKEYENSINSPQVGMFGTGFHTFNKSGNDIGLVKAAIKSFVEISKSNDDLQMFDIIKTNFNDYKDKRAASFSIMFHCLKPNSFPIMNRNEGMGNIFNDLGLKLKKSNNTIEMYTENCKKIRDFRNANFSFKNYRVFDLVARLKQDSDFSIPKIDFIFTMEYINKYGNKPYKAIDRAIDENEEKELLEIKNNAQKAVKEVNKMAEVLESRFCLDKWKPSAWTDGSHTKVRDYLWVKMQYKDYENDIESISIFVNKGTNLPGREKTRIRFSLEMINEGADQKAYSRHHKFLDLPLEEGLCYVVGSDELHDSVVLNEDHDTVKAKTENGTYKKVQISKVINYDQNLSNDEIYSEMIDGVSKLIPYYEYVIGKSLNNVSNVADDDNIDEKGDDTMIQDKINLNTILYGPPGTGKTYNSKVYAVAICNYDGDLEKVKNLDYTNDVIPQYENLVKDGRVAFTTFHQSYGYEEFIQGIKPVLSDDDTKGVHYDVISGVFKKFCDENSEYTQSLKSFGIDENTKIWKMSIEGGKTNVIKECFAENNIRINFDINSKDSSMNIFKNKMLPGDLVLSFESIYEINGVAKIVGEEIEELNDKSKYKLARKVEWILKDKIINIKNANGGVRLSQQTCTELPNLNRNGLYELINKELGQSSVSNTNNKKPCVFIIDEINRGNISKIFGELITLIETSKRKGKDEEMSCILPYNKEEFSVPDNVYILGTMNTADRSIAIMDTALRRRFDFVEMMPDLDAIDGIIVDGIDIRKVLETMNQRIEVLYDREHTLGHAFFMPLIKEENKTIGNLAQIFKNKVIPLLQEYFYEDYSKIQLVLGDNAKTDKNYKFVVDEKIESNLFKGNINTDDLPEKKYYINNDAFNNAESYNQIY